MSGRSSIEWTGATWNPIRARHQEEIKLHQHSQLKILPAGTWGYHCEPISPGCKNCYAEAMNLRTLPAWGTGLAYNRPNRDRVEIYLDEQELLKPLHWKKPRRIFPCSMTDLFAEFVPDEFIDKMVAVMAMTPRHTYQVLTKRASRLPEYFNHQDCAQRIAELVMLYRFTSDFDSDYEFDARDADLEEWPLPNVWFGVSCEDQPRADERIPHLLRTPAALRWVSYEPALGPIDFTALPSASGIGRYLDALSNAGVDPGAAVPAKLDWIVAGGESGPGARPCNLAWLRSARDQCAAAGVPCFVKQLGAMPFDGHSLHKQIHHRSSDGNLYLRLKDRKGGDPTEWPADLRVRQMPALAAAGAQHAP